MKFQSTFFGVLFAGLLSLSGAHAAPFVGSDAALDSRDTLVRAFAAGKPAVLEAETVLDQIVNLNLDALAREGYSDLADRYRDIWANQFAKSLSRRLSAIGDHDPLSAYLVDLYSILSKTLGNKSKYAAILRDLNTMNFAIPVVFSPRRVDREDYGDHFVPFSGIVTYYVSFAACRKAAASRGLGKLGQTLCPKIAVRLEQEMSKRLAPKLADFIYSRANGMRAILKLTNRDFLYLDAHELEASIR